MKYWQIWRKNGIYNTRLAIETIPVITGVLSGWIRLANGKLNDNVTKLNSRIEYRKFLLTKLNWNIDEIDWRGAENARRKPIIFDASFKIWTTFYFQILLTWSKYYRIFNVMKCWSAKGVTDAGFACIICKQIRY